MMTAKFQALEEKALRRLWVDDFIPDRAIDTKYGVNVEGAAWIPSRFDFVASIPQKMLHRRRDCFCIRSFVVGEDQLTLRLEIQCQDKSTK